MIKKEIFMINNDLVEILHVSSDHMKPYLNYDGEIYTFYNSETNLEYLPKWKRVLGYEPTKTIVDGGFRTAKGDEYIYPYNDEKFTVVDNVVYLTAKVTIHYRYKTTDDNKSKINEFNFYFTTNEMLDEFINELKTTINNVTIIKNVSDKNYINK